MAISRLNDILLEAALSLKDTEWMQDRIWLIMFFSYCLEIF